jgi:DnaK suppressor protein
MANNKPRKTENRFSKTARSSRHASSKKKTLKAAGKTVSPEKAVKRSDKTKRTEKVPPKKNIAHAKKKEMTGKIAAAQVATGKVAGKTSDSKSKKKLSAREQKIQEIKKNLIEQRNALLSEAEEALNVLPGQTIFPDMGDQASAEIDRSFMLRLRGREQKLLKKIEAAIEKIDSGAFGICDVCGEEITIKRLEARPVTNMCISCKTEQEEEEKLRGK